jgi:hypothetical protein
MLLEAPHFERGCLLLLALTAFWICLGLAIAWWLGWF